MHLQVAGRAPAARIQGLPLRRVSAVPVDRPCPIRDVRNSSWRLPLDRRLRGGTWSSDALDSAIEIDARPRRPPPSRRRAVPIEPLDRRWHRERRLV
jgi:hypothetical protein